MSISGNGFFGPRKGRIGNVIFYMLNGQPVSRTIGVNKKESTEAQKSYRLITKLCSKFLDGVVAMTDVGFGIEAQGTVCNAYNLATKANKSTIFKGEYPNFEIDYAKVILSQGILETGENFQVAATDEAITFNWKTVEKMAWPESADQVMMLAYFPEQGRSISKIGGNARNSGSDLLQLPPALRGKYTETYVAFVSSDRKRVSDSTYTGSINLNNQ